MTFFNNALASEASWKTWKETSTQSVKYRASAINNKSGSQLLEIKATTKVNSTLSAFLSFIQDVDNTPNWLVNSSESKILKQLSNTQVSFYIKLVRMWPFRPRILLLNSFYLQNKDLSIDIMLTDLNAEQENSLLISKITDIKQLLPITIHHARWKITPKVSSSKNSGDNMEILIEYQFIADGHGSIPQWLADHLALKSVWKSMRNIRRQLPDKKWQQKKVSGITEISMNQFPIIDKTAIPE